MKYYELLPREIFSFDADAWLPSADLSLFNFINLPAPQLDKVLCNVDLNVIRLN